MKVLLGFVDEGIAYQQQALAMAREMDDHDNECVLLNDLGLAYLRNGRVEAAAGCHREALTIARDIDAPIEKGRANDGLARCALEQGDVAAARRFWQSALDVLAELQTPEVDAIRDRLAALPPPQETT